MTNHVVRPKWERGEPAFGIWCDIPSTSAAEVVARCGFDWGCVDWQHGLVDRATTSEILGRLEACGLSTFVRVSATNPSEIGVALDIGAHGVIVPMVESADQAARAGAACRYPPKGVRSIGPMRASTAIGVDPPQVNERVACVVMIETVTGLERVGEIAAVEGVDAVFVGPGDLQLSHGKHPPTTPLSGDVVDAILDGCSQAGTPAGIYAGSADEAMRLAGAGFVFVAVSSDRELLAGAGLTCVRALRGSGADPRDPGGALHTVLGSDFDI